MQTEAVQRLRITYGVDGPLRYLSVLDMGRLWERLLRRARLPLAFTQGFNPHPRMAFAAPLPVGYSSTHEVLDVYLGAIVAPEGALAAICAESPVGLCLQSVVEVPLSAPPMQAIMRAAAYEVAAWSAASPEQMRQCLQWALDSDALLYERVRAGRTQSIDLRPLLLKARYLGQDEAHRLELTMVCSPQGAGRPEELLAALEIGESHWAVCRSRLYWDAHTEE
ncbi:MAG: DUF2344 domain-containing protein [Chloroflexi bacterium]|jgi:radical SAM-linked protein|nr:DUF2344 domain-containing protein [Chloroflexota bacterium]